MGTQEYVLFSETTFFNMICEERKIREENFPPSYAPTGKPSVIKFIQILKQNKIIKIDGLGNVI